MKTPRTRIRISISAYVADRITGFMDHWMTFSKQMMMALLMVGAMVFFSTDRRWIDVADCGGRADLDRADRERDAQRVAGDGGRRRVSDVVLEALDADRGAGGGRRSSCW